jgi:hypothetical protein
MTVKKKKNPLYVVTNKGKDIEQADGVWDALVKKFHLAPVIEFFQMIFDFLLAKVNSYAWFVVIKQKIDELVESLNKLFQFLRLEEPV